MRDHHPVRMVRPLILIVAVIVCAWFALGIRQAQDTDQATAIISGGGPATPSRLRHADSLLGSARLLNPDRTLDLLSVELALRRGQTAKARRIATALVRSEPMNVAAWLWFGRASNGDPRAFLLALEHAHELDPLPLRR
jgi:hypothetical protein